MDVPALKGKAFLAEAKTMKLTIDPVTGDELTRMITGLFTLDPILLARLKTVLYQSSATRPDTS